MNSHISVVKLSTNFLYVVADEFDVSIFLTDTSTRHSVLTKRKDFTNKTRRIRSNSGKMTRLLGANVEKEQMQVADGHSHESIDNTIIIREEEDENDAEASIKLSDIPEVPSKEAKDTTLHPEERRTSTAAGQNKEEAQDISSDDSSAGQKDTMPELVEDVRKKSAKAAETSRDAVDDNKKKLLLHTTYDGFSIYGRILCLIVNYKKPAIAKKNNAGGGLTPANRVGQQMLEQWVSSQAVLNNQIDEMEDG